MTNLLLRKTMRGFEPIDDLGREALSKIGVGDLVRAEIKRPRNTDHHRKFFAMLNLVYENQEHYKSPNDLLEVLKIRIGHCHTVQTKHGEVKIPKSISFAAMDQTEFDQFYNRAVDWVLSEVIPGLQRGELDSEIEQELKAFAA